MQHRSAVTVSLSVVALALTGCATSATPGADAAPTSTVEPSASVSAAPTPDEAAPTPDEIDPVLDESDAARAQAEAWLEAATLPDGAVPAGARVASFSSYTGWPCGPVEQLQAYWRIPGAEVGDTANWIMQHPTADLITTALGPASTDPSVQSAIVGYIPEPGAQEGVVYTIEKISDGVAVRAEIAAMTASGSCPDLPDGAIYGEPGQG